MKTTGYKSPKISELFAEDADLICVSAEDIEDWDIVIDEW